VKRCMSGSTPRTVYFATCCQILNTILGGGAGIVPLPHALRVAGTTVGFTFVCVCGALSAYTACAIIRASELVNEQTLQGVARRTLGCKIAVGVRVLLVAFAFGSGVASLTIFTDVALASYPSLSRTMVVALAGATISPIVVFVRRIERLAPISIASSALVCIFLLYAGWCRSHSVRGKALAHDGVQGAAGLLQALSVVNLSFNCHFNLLSLYHALPALHDIAPPRKARRWQQRRMHLLICTATALALLVYAAVGLLGCWTFEGAPSGNVFADYARLGPVGALINDALATSQLAALPLLVHEGVRETIALCNEMMHAAPSASA
jgi:amino acid permease